MNEFGRTGGVLWTNGSKTEKGGVARAVVLYGTGAESDGEEQERAVVMSRGVHGSIKGGRKIKKGCGIASRLTRLSDGGPGWMAATFTMSGRHTAYDAELRPVPEGLRFLAARGRIGVMYTIFTDPQAAMQRILDGSPGPGQAQAIRGIRLSQAIPREGSISRDSLVFQSRWGQKKRNGGPVCS